MDVQIRGAANLTDRLLLEQMTHAITGTRLPRRLPLQIKERPSPSYRPRPLSGRDKDTMRQSYNRQDADRRTERYKSHATLRLGAQRLKMPEET